MMLTVFKILKARSVFYHLPVQKKTKHGLCFSCSSSRGSMIDGAFESRWEDGLTGSSQEQPVFSGELQDEDVNPASAALTTMITQHLHPGLPVHQLEDYTSLWTGAGKTSTPTSSINLCTHTLA